MITDLNYFTKYDSDGDIQLLENRYEPTTEANEGEIIEFGDDDECLVGISFDTTYDYVSRMKFHFTSDFDMNECTEDYLT